MGLWVCRFVGLLVCWFVGLLVVGCGRWLLFVGCWLLLVVGSCWQLLVVVGVCSLFVVSCSLFVVFVVFVVRVVPSDAVLPRFFFVSFPIGRGFFVMELILPGMCGRRQKGQSEHFRARATHVSKCEATL